MRSWAISHFVVAFFRISALSHGSAYKAIPRSDSSECLPSTSTASTSEEYQTQEIFAYDGDDGNYVSTTTDIAVQINSFFWFCCYMIVCMHWTRPPTHWLYIMHTGCTTTTYPRTQSVTSRNIRPLTLTLVVALPGSFSVILMSPLSVLPLEKMWLAMSKNLFQTSNR